MKDYKIVLELSKFIDSRLIEIQNDETGGCEQGIFIPTTINGILVSKRNKVYVCLLAREKKNRISWDTHSLTIRFNKGDYQRIKELGYLAPYVGNMSPTKKFYNNPTHQCFFDDNSEDIIDI